MLCQNVGWMLFKCILSLFWFIQERHRAQVQTVVLHSNSITTVLPQHKTKAPGFPVNSYMMITLCICGSCTWVTLCGGFNMCVWLHLNLPCPNLPFFLLLCEDWSGLRWGWRQLDCLSSVVSSSSVCLLDGFTLLYIFSYTDRLSLNETSITHFVFKKSTRIM